MKENQEIELKFIVLYQELIKYLDLNLLESKQISQYYFSKKKIKDLLIPFAIKTFGDLKDFHIHNFKNVRIREIKSEGIKKYFITIKSPSAKDLSRFEFEKEISLEDFNYFKKEVDKGGVVKRRYFYNHSSYEFEIDELLEANFKKVELSLDLKFISIDIEVDNVKEIEIFRNKLPEFDFLNSAFELSTLFGLDKNILGMRNLARSGVDLEVLEFIKKYLK